ncbi:hypothetical protein [Arthrobacter mobilis]|uniref:Ribosomal protein L7/L12 C-terminal domain-containing protein n=1 Tax=Arthrobacter mobilis TaxID=2724944 RepID=A0A7X6HEN4_9MICC|nr:hypothetical protein [Arthrobacter mobilis]NKX55621.1 hypothetical protein [Arthrobacter mobilis]
MESFLVPALILLVVIAAVLLAVKLARKRPAADSSLAAPGQAKGGPVPTREAAAAATARLDQQQHTAVYSMIARGHGLEAIQAYRKATGTGLREAAAAVASMSAYPQPYVHPEFPQAADTAGPAQAPAGQTPPAAEQEPEAEASGGTPGTAAGAGARPEEAEARPEGAAARPAEEALPGGGEPPREEQQPVPPPEPVRPAQPAAAESPAPPPGTADAVGKPSPGAPASHKATAYRYRAIVSKGDEIREIASTRLNDEIFARIRETALSGDLPAAARLLREHSDAGEQEALEFVALIGPEEE